METRKSVAENRFTERSDGSATSKSVTSIVPVHRFKLRRPTSTVAPLARSMTGSKTSLRPDFAHCQAPTARSATSEVAMSPAFHRNKGTGWLSADPRPSLADLPSNRLRVILPISDCTKASNFRLTCKSALASRIF